MRVQGWRSLGSLDAAEPTASRARVAHEHDGRCRGRLVAPAPTVGNIRASRLFADGVQIQSAQVVLDLLVIRAVRDRGLQPRWKAGDFFFLALGADEGCL